MSIPEGPLRVLVVEDDPFDLELLRSMLAAGTAMTVEPRGRVDAAITRLAAGGVDAVVLDLGLPDGRGLEVFRKVHAAAPAVPVVVLTGCDDEQLALQAVGEGAQDYFVKWQVTAPVLRRALRFAVLRNAQQRSAEKSRDYPRVQRERRREERLTIGLPVRLRSWPAPTDDAAHRFATTLDVAREGAAVLLDAPLLAGEVLQMVLPMPKRFRTHDITAQGYPVFAEVRYACAVAGGTRVGVVLLSHPPRVAAATVPVPAPAPPAPPAPLEPAPVLAHSPAERRAQPRYPMFLNVRLRLLTGSFEGRQEKTVTENLGRQGALVLTSLPATRGETVLLDQLGGGLALRAEVEDVHIGLDNVPRLSLRFLDDVDDAMGALLRQAGLE